jgi:dipeptide/tripeptide permease
MIGWLPMDIKLQFGNTMSDTTQQSPKTEAVQELDGERTKQVTVAGWTAGLTAFFACLALGQAPTWPMAFGVAAVAAMVAVVCYFILKRG